MGTKRYLARFKVEADSISHHREEEDFEHESEDINRDGRNISAIELTDMRMKEGDQMPDLPEFKVYNESDFDDDTKFTLSGYPSSLVGEITGTKGEDDYHVEKLPCKNKMYSSEGPISVKGNKVLEADLLADDGQIGGAVTFEHGSVFGIYTACLESETEESNMSFCVRISQRVFDWVDGL